MDGFKNKRGGREEKQKKEKRECLTVRIIGSEMIVCERVVV